MRRASVSTVSLSGLSVNVPAMRMLPSVVLITARASSSSGLPNVLFQTSSPDAFSLTTQASVFPAPKVSVLPAKTKSPLGSRVTAFAVLFPAPPNVLFQTSSPDSFSLTTQAPDLSSPQGAMEPTNM